MQILGVANGKIRDFRDAEMSILESEPETLQKFQNPSPRLVDLTNPSPRLDDLKNPTPRLYAQLLY